MKNSDIKVFIDLDGVVADFSLAMCDIMDIKYDDLKGHLENRYYISNSVDENIFWEKVKNAGPQWWENIQLLPWAKTLYERVSQEACVCFLTAPHVKDTQSFDGKAKWILKHFNTNKFLIGKPKEFCASPNSILIDDYKKNIKRFIEAGGNAYLWPNPDKLKSNKNWDIEINNIIEIIRKLKNNIL